VSKSFRAYNPLFNSNSKRFPGFETKINFDNWCSRKHNPSIISISTLTKPEEGATQLIEVVFKGQNLPNNPGENIVFTYKFKIKKHVYEMFG
jgi:hypothetical protein